MRTILFALVVAMAVGNSPAMAQDFLDGDGLARELGGKTIKGYYLADNVGFVEVYLPDGRITYKDDIKADAGNWSVRGRAFCTFYDRIGGACWYVIKISGNCFEFYLAPDDGRDTDRATLTSVPPQARAARDSDTVTCEGWLGS